MLNHAYKWTRTHIGSSMLTWCKQNNDAFLNKVFLPWTSLESKIMMYLQTISQSKEWTYRHWRNSRSNRWQESLVIKVFEYECNFNGFFNLSKEWRYGKLRKGDLLHHKIAHFVTRWPLQNCNGKCHFGTGWTSTISPDVGSCNHQLFPKLKKKTW